MDVGEIIAEASSGTMDWSGTGIPPCDRGFINAFSMLCRAAEEIIRRPSMSRATVATPCPASVEVRTELVCLPLRVGHYDDLKYSIFICDLLTVLGHGHGSVHIMSINRIYVDVPSRV